LHERFPGSDRILRKNKLKKPTTAAKPPAHLRPSTKLFYSNIVDEFSLEIHHLVLLLKACEALDRADEARDAIKRHGMVYENRFGQPVARPECGIERDSRLAFARLIREIGLDVAPPSESRPATLRGNR
jgi:phage terminase small subunit